MSSLDDKRQPVLCRRILEIVLLSNGSSGIDDDILHVTHFDQTSREMISKKSICTDWWSRPLIHFQKNYHEMSV